MLVNVNDAQFCVIDTETTDLSPQNGRVIEVAAGIVAGGEIVEVFSSLVNPGPGVDPGRTDIHRITRAMLDDAPSFAEVAGELVQRMAGRVIVAHNAAFDLSHLEAEFARAGLSFPQVTPMCTLRGARKYLSLPNNRLGTVCDHLGIDVSGWHAAGADVAATAQVLMHLLKSSNATSVPVTPMTEWPRVTTPTKVLARV